MHPFLKILAFVALLIAGNVLASIGLVGIALIEGIDLMEFVNNVLYGEGEFPKSMLRGMLWVQAIAGFLLPAFAFGWIFYRKSWIEYFRLHKAPTLVMVSFSLIALIAAYPLVQLSFEVNAAIPLPDWMTSLEDNAAEMMKDILEMNSVGGFLITILLVAILPGIGEELVFRGILQRQIQEWTKRPVLSVWIAAIVFSAIHMQFEGFFARVALGALLGFMYLWSNNLWVPIILHAFNNGMQVSILYFTGVDLSSVEQQSPMPVNAWIIVLSVFILYLCYDVITKSRQRHG